MTKVLVVRFAAIGDCVMAAWPATALRMAYPDARIVWAVETRCAGVVDTTTLVQDRREFPRHRWKSARWSPITWREQLVAYTALGCLGFDVGIDFQGHSKTALCLRLARPRVRVSARATDAFAARLNPIPLRLEEGVHEVEHYRNLLRHLGVEDWPERPIMPPRPPSPLPPGRWATIQTGAGVEDKRYPAEAWAEVARKLKAAGFQVAAIGAARDPKLPEDAAMDLVGRLDLHQAMAAVEAGAVHLAADTGTGHIAAALGVPVVSVFGRTDPRSYRPWTDQGRVLRRDADPAATTVDDVIAAALEIAR